MSKPILSTKKEANYQIFIIACLYVLFDNAARLSKKTGNLWNCLLEHTPKRSPGINRKRRILHPGPGCLSSAEKAL